MRTASVLLAALLLLLVAQRAAGGDYGLALEPMRKALKGTSFEADFDAAATAPRRQMTGAAIAAVMGTLRQRILDAVRTGHPGAQVSVAWDVTGRSGVVVLFADMGAGARRQHPPPMRLTGASFAGCCRVQHGLVAQHAGAAGAHIHGVHGIK